MEYLKTFESFMGDIARLNPNRNNNDNKALELFDEIFTDFHKFNNDLKKSVYIR